jgi:hypothetical protein
MNNTVDPKQAAGEKKCPMHLLPTVFLRGVARVLGGGARKYGEWNWRSKKSKGVKAQTYIAAIRRHLSEWQDGIDADAESGEHPLDHIAATCAVLRDAEACGKLIDDRPKVLLAEDRD